MKRAVVGIVLALVAGMAWAGPVRVDLATIVATEGPTGPGFSVGADVPFGGDWAYSLRAARIADDDAQATSLTAGLEYALAYGQLVPYLGARVGARWAEEDVTICATPPKKSHAWKAPAPVCSDEEEESDGLLYQAALGIDFKSKGAFGVTAEAAYSAGEGEGVEFLIGLTIRP